MSKQDQPHFQQTIFDTERPATRDSGPVICLGMTFPNDEERRKHFLGILRKKLQDPEFRKIEGFPIGSDEDILNLSDPPYYTACPNPWIADFIREWEEEKKSLRSKVQSPKSGSETLDLGPETLDPEPYHREPFAADVSEGKNHPIYNAHSYHTKVPHRAIMRYILHYTEPGDIVFDGFCGTGMTGVAAQMCGDRDEVIALGYQVKKDGAILQQELDDNGKTVWQPFSKLGTRKVVLNDLSPAATFIAYNYNTPVNVKAFEREAKRILKEVEAECGWMYETLHVEPVEPASSRLSSKMSEPAGSFEPAGSRLYSDFQPCDPFQATTVTYRQDNLPHIQVPGATYFITFHTNNFRSITPEAREIVLSAIRYWDNQRLKLFSAVVMPDHVHIIAKLLPKTGEQYWDLAEVLHSIKSFSANEINKTENKTGTPVWQVESYDRIIRDHQELGNELAYINHNPVKAGLVQKAEEYPFRFVAPELIEAGWKPALRGKINYTVWSDVFVCPECSHEVIFWQAAVDKEAGKIQDEFPCPHCQAELTKRKMERAWVSRYDSALKKTVRQARQVPVLINYTIGKKRFEKTPDKFDLALIEKIDNSEIPYWFPTDRMMKGGETRRNDPIGITHVHHFYTKRNLWILAALLAKSNTHTLKLIITGILQISSKQSSFRYDSRNPKNTAGGILKGTLYVPSLSREGSIFENYKRRKKSITSGFESESFTDDARILGTSSFEATSLLDNSLDYIFIDPPFGANINYSELNVIWESWLKVWTDNKSEAIENKVQKKGLTEYRQLILSCFREAYRVLKPGRWMTVEFSNTRSAVWNAIQSAITDAGFIVANVSALDKKQGSFKAVTTPTAVKQDLVISAYKPNGGFEERFQKLLSRQDAGSTEAVWEFVRTHLKYLPVVKVEPASSRLSSIEQSSSQLSSSRLQPIPERDPRILFDQMVAYYVRKGYMVPVSSQEFQVGLAQRFIERDGMYFLPDQVAEYDRKKMISGAPQQLSLFVSDESSAIQWLRQLIKAKPQTFSDINPQFMQQLGGWSKNEAQLDLRELLNQNFLCYDGKGDVPNQIHAYLSTNWKEFRNLPKNDPALVAKARDRWYMPDPNKASDLEKLREKALLKEFEHYVELASSQRKLKLFRLEAVRAGFKKAWQERDYAVIVAVATKIPNKVLEEDPKLLMWYDQAVTRMGS